MNTRETSNFDVATMDLDRLDLDEPDLEINERLQVSGYQCSAVSQPKASIHLKPLSTCHR